MVAVVTVAVAMRVAAMPAVVVPAVVPPAAAMPAWRGRRPARGPLTTTKPHAPGVCAPPDEVSGSSDDENVVTKRRAKPSKPHPQTYPVSDSNLHAVKTGHCTCTANSEYNKLRLICVLLHLDSARVIADRRRGADPHGSANRGAADRLQERWFPCGVRPALCVLSQPICVFLNAACA